MAPIKCRRGHFIRVKVSVDEDLVSRVRKGGVIDRQGMMIH